MARPQRKLLQQQQKYKKSLLKTTKITTDQDCEMSDSPDIRVVPKDQHQEAHNAVPKPVQRSKTVMREKIPILSVEKKISKQNKSAIKRQNLLKRLIEKWNQQNELAKENQRKHRQQGFDMRALLVSAAAPSPAVATPSLELPQKETVESEAVEHVKNVSKEIDAQPRVTSRRGRLQTLRKEQNQLLNVLRHPVYQQRPVSVIREHLMNKLKASTK